MSAGIVGTLLSLLATLGVAWLLTYAVHSTALIGGVWLAERAGLLRSLRLRDLAWRTALVGGLVTATLQLAAAGSGLAGELSFPRRSRPRLLFTRQRDRLGDASSARAFRRRRNGLGRPKLALGCTD